MIRRAFATHVLAVALLAPLAFFLGVFFVSPLFSMMRTAVTDEAVLLAFPSMPEATARWNDRQPPTTTMQAALVADIRSSRDQQVLGEAVRRLNSAQPGFRSLMGLTISAVRAAGEQSVDLIAVDKRWADPKNWKAIVDALPPYTDRFMLAAIDYGRSPDGAIIPLPSETSSHKAIFLTGMESLQ